MRSKEQKAEDIKRTLIMIKNKRLNHSVILCDIFVLAPSGSRKDFYFMYGKYAFAKYGNGVLTVEEYKPAVFGKDKYVFEMFTDIAELIGMKIVYKGAVKKKPATRKKKTQTKTKKK